MVYHCVLQCFDAIEQAYSFVDTEDMEDAIIFVHTGIYVGEFLLIDLNVAIVGAGKVPYKETCNLLC